MRQSQYLCHKRPPLSAPASVIPAYTLFYLLWGLTLPVAGMGLSWVLRLDYDPVMDNFILVVLVAAVPLLAVTFGLRYGEPWSLKLMRSLAVLAASVLMGDVVAGLLLTFQFIGDTRHDYLNGELLLILSVFLGALAFFLFRTLRRVRWLDPYSTPDEWEPPMRKVRRVD